MRLAGVVLIIRATLLIPHRPVSGATTIETNHHLRSERQTNAGHQHVTHLDANTKTEKKSLRLLSAVMDDMGDFCSAGRNICHKNANCALGATTDTGSCTCKDGYTGDGKLVCAWYDTCANMYPCAPPEQGGYCEDRAPDAAIYPPNIHVVVAMVSHQEQSLRRKGVVH